MANLIGDPDVDPHPATIAGVPAAFRDAGVALHWYGKRQLRPHRKMAHVTVSGGDDRLARARAARDAVSFTDTHHS